MQTNYQGEAHYTEHDTERVRRDEMTAREPSANTPSSAGVPTQPLTLDNEPTDYPAHLYNRSHTVVSIVLLVLGIATFLGQLLPRSDATGGLVLLTIASCFLFFAFWRRIYGLLIPGSILAGLSLGVPFAQLTNGVSVLWGLALGFLTIMLVGRALFRATSPWPVYPAVILFAVGTITAVSSLPSFFALSLLWLPLLLIGAGLYLGWGRQLHG